MTKPKRKKHNNTQSDVSDVSGVLESELLIRIEALEEKVEECARQNTQRILDELERVRGQVHSLNLENETLRKELKELREERAILVEEVCQANQTAKLALKQTNNLEQYARKNNIRISGLRDSESETEEKTKRSVCKLISEKLGVASFDSNSIDIAHRLGKYGQNRDRAVIVRFNTHSAAKRVLGCRRALKGTNVYMTEDLTKINANRLQKVRDLETVALAWTRGGEIFAKDHNGVVTKINNDEDIHQVNTRLGRSNQGTWMRGRGGDNIASVRPKTYTNPSLSKNGDTRESNTGSSEAGSAGSASARRAT
ncbi:unconventional myosin-Vb-like [Elysia marginata]|uniref:Unconventional myosin-Vb-like n=2 Tax=Elysia marginata TaxID=1093978 RepID=A0AAV4HU43_9GAST|nr:unconventional myosin-Vb-like [Elysia marginata]